jgi:hypothetical protein
MLLGIEYLYFIQVGIGVDCSRAGISVGLILMNRQPEQQNDSGGVLIGDGSCCWQWRYNVVVTAPTAHWWRDEYVVVGMACVMVATAVVFLLVSVVVVGNVGELLFCQQWRSLRMADDDEVVGRVVLYLICEGDGI